MTALKCLTRLQDGCHIVLSPKVGLFTPAHEAGAYVDGTTAVGKLLVINTYHDLVLPAGVTGRVVINGQRDKIVPVSYDQELFRLEPIRDLGAGDLNVAGSGALQTPEDEEGFLVTAFTTGIFYAKPSPDAPPFVELGQTVEKGKAMGLIEVMKTFNHILFHGTDNGDVGKVKKIYVSDGEEVKSGQPLFLIG